MSRIGVVRSRVLFASALLSLLGATFWSVGPARACLAPAVPRDEAAPSDTQLGADLPGPRYLSGSTARRMLHFTFDDGPTPENTPRLLDALDRAGMKATFFFSTSRFASRERRNARALDLAREVARRGHEVGAHGFDHIRMSRLPPGAVRTELESSEAMFRRAFGTRTYLFRPPYGSRNRALDRMLADGRYLTVMWNVGLADWVARDPAQLRKIFWRVLLRNERKDGTRGGVVLLHDSHDWSVSAFELIVDSIASRNCQLLERGEELYVVTTNLEPWVSPPSDETYAAWQSELRASTESRCRPKPEEASAQPLALGAASGSPDLR